MEKEIKIAMLQMASAVSDVDANIKKVETLMKNEFPQGVDVLVLPEVWTVGWDCSSFQKSASENHISSILNFLSQTAKKYNVNIIGGSYIDKKGEKYYNTCPVFDNTGRFLTSYSKMHLYSYYGCDEGKYITKGENPVMVNLCGINFGLTICYDIRFPEIYREYAKSGADVLVNCAAWGSKKPIPWEMMTKSRAIENQCYMVALTQCGHIKEDEYNLGHSRIIDYKGEELNFIKDKEGIVCANLNIDKMRKFRSLAPTICDIRNNYEVKILCER